ncbi:MAG: MFS transporter [Erysipelotrichaceae bacterium]|nr:MFS transporter [Erysipelotrichaceae bacterium]
MALKTKTKQLILLLVIYLSFISLGLPDGSLGVAWPLMRVEFGMPIQAAAWVVLVTLPLSAISSVMSTKVGARFGYGKVTTGSALLTAFSLIGIALSRSYFGLLFFGIGLGIGQGAVDALLNYYVAHHYSSRHMTWLHGFWGVGATLGPAIFTLSLAMTGKWTSGYINIGLLQIFIGIILLLTIGFWDQKVEVAQVEERHEKGKFEPRMIYGLSFYFLYVGAEFGVGLWTNSYLVESLHIDPKISGLFVAGYYAAIMSGRFLSGIISNKLGNQNMLRLGLSIAILGLGILSLKPSAEVTRIALILTGLGFAPLYPSMMHETPKRFNIQNGALMIGLQVGVSYVGGTLITNALGQWFAWTSIDWLYPIIFVLALGMMIVSEFYKSSSKQFKSTESTMI